MSDRYRLGVARPGGPEAIERLVFDATPRPGEVLIRNTAIGVNFIDVYHRTGLYPRPYPAGLGTEGAGIVEAVADDVGTLAVGDRVGYLQPRTGSYGTHAIAPATTTFRLPGTISDETAAAVLLKGLTAWMLVERCAHVAPGDHVLIHAAAGGVGSLAVQWAKARGLTVIAHAGSADKAARASDHGPDHALHCGFGELAAAVRDLTGGRGVQAVLDGIGRDSFDASLASLARCGMLVSYGNASGPVDPIAPLTLSKAGSLFLTRPTLFDHIAEPTLRDAAADALWKLLDDGQLRVGIGQRFTLSDAAVAHRALEARQTTGSTILLP